MPESRTQPSKKDYYLKIAEAVAQRSTCLDDEIIATGYNGAPRGDINCCDIGQCWRETNHVPHGEQYEKCVAVHAEQNAIISASLRFSLRYLYKQRLINNAGISCIITRHLTVWL